MKDPEKEAAQKRLAALLVSKEVQVAFNLKKGSLPIRGDVDLAAANDCMKKGLAILAKATSCLQATRSGHRTCRSRTKT